VLKIGRRSVIVAYLFEENLDYDVSVHSATPALLGQRSRRHERPATSTPFGIPSEGLANIPPCEGGPARIVLLIIGTGTADFMP
jgi:hypothetical protein